MAVATPQAHTDDVSHPIKIHLRSRPALSRIQTILAITCQTQTLSRWIWPHSPARYVRRSRRSVLEQYHSYVEITKLVTTSLTVYGQRTKTVNSRVRVGVPKSCVTHPFFSHYANLSTSVLVMMISQTWCISDRGGWRDPNVWPCGGSIRRAGARYDQRFWRFVLCTFERETCGTSSTRDKPDSSRLGFHWTHKTLIAALRNED